MPTTIQDMFSGSFFDSVTLTDLVNQNYPFAPGFLTAMNIAGSGTGIATTKVAFEDITGTNRMITTTPRGAPPSQIVHAKGAVKALEAAHLSREVTVYADELLGVRAHGTADPQTLQNLLMSRVEGPIGVKANWALTMEHWYLGMIDGVVYEPDGTTEIWNYYTWTGTSRPTAININFGTMTATTAGLVAFGLAIKRKAQLALNGLPDTGRPTILCGDNFYDALLQCQEITKARQTGAFGAQDALSILSSSTPWTEIVYAGCRWVNYRGTVDGLVGVPTDEARFFMEGVPGLFQKFYAPADTFETVSDVGLPYFMLNDPSGANNARQVVFELQSNPLVACIRPTSLIRITKS